MMISSESAGSESGPLPNPQLPKTLQLENRKTTLKFLIKIDTRSLTGYLILFFALLRLTGYLILFFSPASLLKAKPPAFLISTSRKHKRDDSFPSEPVSSDRREIESLDLPSSFKRVWNSFSSSGELFG
ncbi:hypothetical protein JTE90_011365 [Oedothorax gibbosus]|uniref:Uncharacterized protein n=1 Tax=Oedothorax gibbosus TaxID=931172 RepID=A0AAV6VMA5_9ARAC|nr:hypothetical protein JTE90_011365 [Oedothorax gibbosus]